VQRLQDFADLGGLLAAFKLRQEARTQVTKPGDRDRSWKVKPSMLARFKTLL
jgi:hypothetical protein